MRRCAVRVRTGIRIDGRERKLQTVELVTYETEVTVGGVQNTAAEYGIRIDGWERELQTRCLGQKRIFTGVNKRLRIQISSAEYRS